MSVALSEVLAAVAGAGVTVDGARLDDVEVRGVQHDSRRVGPGDLFVAWAGAAHDGHEHVAAAGAAGAAAALVERPVPGAATPQVRVDNARLAAAVAAGFVAGSPWNAIRTVAVTGTNGKTSVALLLRGLLARRAPAAAVGTLGVIGADGRVLDGTTGLTTPGPVRIAAWLADLARSGVAAVALEASSHALDQHRLDGVRFDVVAFTNLTRDHLDYHGSLAAYGAAKRRLFEFPSLRRAVVNVDDGFGRRLAQSLPRLDLCTYGSPAADLFWERVEHRPQGVRARLQSPWGRVELNAPVCGDFGLANLGAVIGVLGADGLPLADIAAAVEAAPGVPGRMEFFRRPALPTVVVDYAHTPDALAKALGALRRHCRGRLQCVVGCGGDRDSGKRPLMAQAAVRMADGVWLTSDNPRSEDPMQIIEDMAAGVAEAPALVKEVDRRAAIAAAVGGAGPEDLVLVAGKGHEHHQEIAGRRLPFSDRRVVSEILQAMGEEG